VSPLKTTKLSELSGHTGPVYCLHRGRTAQTVFSGGADGFVAEWNLATFEPEKFSVKLDAPVFSLCLIPGTTLLVVGLFNGHIHVIDWQARQEIKHLALDTKGVFTLCYDPGSQLLYAGGGDGVMYVWNITSWELMLSLPLSEKKIRHISVSGPDILVCSGDGLLRVLEPVFFNEKFSLMAHQDGIYHALADGDLLFTVGKDAYIRVWDRKTFQQQEAIAAHNYAIYSLVKCRELLATGSRDKTIKIWGPAGFGHPLRIDNKNFKGHQRSVNSLYFCEWNNSLISAGDDGKIMAWDLEQC
jgi:WD40 repeat protein